MSGLKIRGFGSVELDERDTKHLDATKPIKVADIYRDNSFEIGE